MTINFNNSPYWDDYQEEKGFLRILFRPGYAVQGRELTQLQTIQQNQISRFGSFVFKSGSQVLGGQITLDTKVTYLNLQPQYANTNINVTQFANNIITDTSNTIRASVIAVIPSVTGGTAPPTLMVKYLTGSTFANGQIITTEGGNVFATLANTNSQGLGACASLQDGVFFIDLRNINATSNANANTAQVLTNGYFVRVPAQTVVLSPYTNTPTVRVGLQISDAIITEQIDSSLLDPALESTNFTAPGAHRYIINAVLSSRSMVSEDDTAFVELLRTDTGQLTSIQKFPVLSDINKVLAQRTYDTNGDFTVSPFAIKLVDSSNNDSANANTQNYNAVLDAGLAYVQGYRTQTVSKTVLNAPRARTYANVQNALINTYYGNYVLIDTVNGEFNISTLPQVDIHCVPWQSVNTVTRFAYANTLLGTARLRAFEFNSASNSANDQTYIFRTHLFDINTSPIVGVATASGTANITFPALFSSTTNAYTGVVINIPTTGDKRTITSYNGSSKVATIDSNWSSNPGATNFVLLSSIQNAESLGLNSNSSFATANGNINIGSKNQFSAYQNVSITDSNFQTLVFPLPNQTIAQGLSDQTYQYRYRVATGQTLQAGVPLIINLTVPGDATAKFAATGVSGSDLVTLSDFLVVRNPGGGVTGNIIPMVASLGRSVSATDTTATFTMNGSDPTLNNIDIYASIDSGIGAKTKTYTSANVTNWQTSGGTSVGPATVFLSSGQVQFATPSTSNLTTPGSPQDIYISDVQQVVAIIDSGELATAISDAMVVAAVAGTTMPGSSVNITNNYTFFGGQKDSYYDHATLTLKPGAPVPKGRVGVIVNYFAHSSTGGFFSVDSYSDYTNIPRYQSETATILNLRDCIDFRPRRDDSTTAYTFSNSGTILLPEPIPGSGFTTDFAYYLGRVDKIVLTQDGQFQIVQGTASLSPASPKTPEQSMLLYTLAIPPYTFFSANVVPQIQDNKRYTMSDIGILDKRIKSLEYYTALNSLEKNAAQQNITDSNGLSRPKNGILVDSFTGSSIADVTNSDYFAAIDPEGQELRAPFNIDNVPLSFNAALSSNYSKSGKILTLPYSVTALVDQPTASRTENLNPFNVTVWNGSMLLDPESDTWIDTQQAPALITNLTGGNDNWAAMGSTAVYTQWNDWQTVWTGVNINQQNLGLIGPQYGQQTNGVYTDALHAENGWSAWAVMQNQVTSTTSQTVSAQKRTGIQTTISQDVITKSIGTNIINISIVPYMRSKVVKFVARSMKPLTQVYPFFDSANVTPYTLGASVITFTNSVSFVDTYQDQEIIVDNDGGTNGGLGANSATVLLCKGDKVYVRNVKGVIRPGKTFVGQTSGLSGVVASFQHNSGHTGEEAGKRYQSVPFVNGVTPLANANSIVLAGAANTTDGFYVGNTIYIASGDGIAKTSVITAYNGASRIATVSPAWGVSLTNINANFYYNIGSLNTDDNGYVCGEFILPSTSSVKFATGTSVFLVTDSRTGDVASATTKAQDAYTAQGTLETTQEQFVTTRVPVITTRTVEEDKTVVSDPVTTYTVTPTVVGYVDPLAQTFLIDNTIYPDGVFITSIRVCFFSKDNNIPVTLQIRPTNNGYPDSGVILPFSETVLTPNKIKVTQTPSLDDPNQYTEFTFSAPIQLLPGTEYAIVLISNSNKYQIYAAASGDKYLGSDRIIPAPPYLGVLFKSQNSSTWTAYQGESLMFRVMKAVFTTTNPMVLTFNQPAFTANVPMSLMPNNEIYMDVINLTNQDQGTKKTTLGYAYRATANTSRVLDAGYNLITPATNYFFSNRNVATPSGNNFYVQTTGRSTSQHISPIVDAERYSVLAIRQIITNGGISNSNITITNPGKGYNVANTNLVTVSGGGGSGATLQIGSVDANGNITSIIVTNGGSGYAGRANGTVTAQSYTPSVNATFIISSELDKSGGIFPAKYITRMVTLASGMDAGDLNITFDAHKPAGTQIYVYYKIMSGQDSDSFKNKPYVQMSLEGTDAFSTGVNDFTEYTYVGSLDSLGNPIRQIGYDNYTSFKYFAIKIVLASNNPTTIPEIQNLRCFAMPGTN